MSNIEAVVRTTKLLIQWRIDIESGEMIQSRNYCKNFMIFEDISNNEAEKLASIVNNFFESFNSNLRVSTMGNKFNPFYKRHNCPPSLNLNETGLIAKFKSLFV